MLSGGGRCRALRLPQAVFRPEWERQVLAVLTIDLQDGFKDDAVTVRVNEREVLSRKNVNTKFQIGFAESIVTEIGEGHASIDVQVPSKNLSRKVAVDVAGPLFLGISIDPEDGIDLQISSEPFGYL